MKSILTFLILIAAGFVAGFAAARGKTIELISAKIAPQPPAQFKADFRPNPYPLEDLRFSVVILGRNNGAYVEKTLESVFAQKYENYRIVYIDDASDDGSYDLAKEIIYGSEKLPKVLFYQNSEAIGPLASLSQFVRSCSDEEIIVVLDGEDWLAHEWVLERLNQYYADPDLWLTYGQSSDYPTYQLGAARPLQENGKPIRLQPFTATQLRTFYAGLFKKISESDFQYKGEYFQASSDLAYMLPMLEMGKDHSQCLSEVLYICNKERPFSEDRELQAFCEKYIRSMKPYSEITSLDLKIGEIAAE